MTDLADTPTLATDSESVGPPAVARWIAGMLSTVFALTVVGLSFAMLGIFEIWLVAPLSTIVAIAVHRLWAGGPLVKAPTRVWVAAVLVALASTVTNALMPSEQVIGGRDGGTYLATGAWVARDGGILIKARTGAYEDVPDLEFDGLGFFDTRSDGRLRPQFLHGFPVLLAATDDAGGLELAMRTNAILGGLALLIVFGFAQLLVRPWLAVLAQAALAANLVFVFYARAPFSEILALLFVFGGLWAWWTAHRATSYPTMVLAGLLMGASLLARIDSLVLLIPLMALRAYEQRNPRRTPDSGRLLRGFWLGLMPMLALALVDLIVITPDYLALQKTSILAIILSLAAVVGVDAVFGGRLIETAQRATQQVRRRVAWMVPVVIVVVLAFAYFVRPLVQEVVGDSYPVTVQDADESHLAEGRTFAEDSAVWLGWYLGPVGLAVAVLGWGLVTRRVLLGRLRFAIPFLLVFSTMALGYLARPSINPDHIWAMRRFLPVVIPGLLVVAAFMIGELWDFDAKQQSRYRTKAAAVVLAFGLIAGSALATAPVADLHEFDGMAADLLRGCDRVGEDTALLFIGDGDVSAGLLMAASYRGYCGFPTAYTDRTDGEFIGGLRDAWKAEGRDLWIASTDRSLLDDLAGGGSIEFFVGDYEQLELTLMRRPEKMTPVVIRLYAVEA